eukprot:302602-Chlamydomonas_euryale.AAC.3
MYTQQKPQVARLRKQGFNLSERKRQPAVDASRPASKRACAFVHRPRLRLQRRPPHHSTPCAAMTWPSSRQRASVAERGRLGRTARRRARTRRSTGWGRMHGKDGWGQPRQPTPA